MSPLSFIMVIVKYSILPFVFVYLPSKAVGARGKKMRLKKIEDEENDDGLIADFLFAFYLHVRYSTYVTY